MNAVYKNRDFIGRLAEHFGRKEGSVMTNRERFDAVLRFRSGGPLPGL